MVIRLNWQGVVKSYIVRRNFCPIKNFVKICSLGRHQEENKVGEVSVRTQEHTHTGTHTQEHTHKGTHAHRNTHTGTHTYMDGAGRPSQRGPRSRVWGSDGVPGFHHVHSHPDQGLLQHTFLQFCHPLGQRSQCWEWGRRGVHTYKGWNQVKANGQGFCSSTLEPAQPSRVGTALVSPVLTLGSGPSLHFPLLPT